MRESRMSECRKRRHGMRRIRIAAGFLLCMLFIAGWGVVKVDLKISKPMIDLDVMIEDAKIGHTDKVLDTGDAADDKTPGEDDDPVTRVPDTDEATEEPEETKEPTVAPGIIDDHTNEVSVRIRHTEIYLNENVCSYEVFAVEIAKLPKLSGRQIDTELIDDYAEYKTYVKVKKQLEELEIRYKETER